MDSHSSSDEVVTENNTPFFSIVIPAYNSAQYIADALRSAFAQTVNSYEIIVVNDGSPDTAELEKEIAPFRDAITYIKRQNGGPGAARNTGIVAAQGKYIAFLDSDDQWLPTHLEQMLEVLRDDPSLDLIYGDAVNFGEVGEQGGTTMDHNPSEGLATFESLVLGKCTVVGSTVVARRQALVDAGLFDESFEQGEDFDLWMRVAYGGGRLDYRRRIHVRRRIHKGNLTLDTIGSFEGQARALRKLMINFDLPESLRQDMQRELEKCAAAIALEKCKQELVAKRYDEAVSELERANASFRSRKLKVVLWLMRTMPQVVRQLYLRRRNTSRVIATSVSLLLKFGIST